MGSVRSHHPLLKKRTKFYFAFPLSRSFTLQSLVIPWPGAFLRGPPREVCANVLEFKGLLSVFQGTDEFSNRTRFCYDRDFVTTKKNINDLPPVLFGFLNGTFV